MTIGPIKKGLFHKWLGKSEDEPITKRDIQKALNYRGKGWQHVHRMAAFVKSAKKWNHAGIIDERDLGYSKAELSALSRLHNS